MKISSIFFDLTIFRPESSISKSIECKITEQNAIERKCCVSSSGDRHGFIVGFWLTVDDSLNAPKAVHGREYDSTGYKPRVPYRHGTQFGWRQLIEYENTLDQNHRACAWRGLDLKSQFGFCSELTLANQPDLRLGIRALHN